MGVSALERVPGIDDQSGFIDQRTRLRLLSQSDYEFVPIVLCKN